MAQQQQKIRKLENNYTRRRELEFQTTKASISVRRRRKKRALIIISVFMIFALIFTAQIIRAKVNYAAVNVQISKQKQKVKKERAEHKRLTAQVSQLNDKDYVEQLIRDRYYYTKPGETVYSFPNKAPKDVNNGNE
ncbi:FtsB family cell division protein [Lentilactobacillus farraginis]|uniref:Septum formation initiator n=1 Tax=Lentilactobacillus farraginis DSM 18382 = JCM 14108 TaxID=1423743 RepID=X0QCN6_9LACO|nr:septum formation initiator family protein [Lentilactobacillus farraginis]KRM09626.1 septum formation initiator protein [Lentilactobacillus farraginis DSM 18382 = JCM 14108]GAF36380.1 septum formation initiator [Lentilactobacillus farraginis DSM 18382 = JCM 14108]